MKNTGTYALAVCSFVALLAAPCGPAPASALAFATDAAATASSPECDLQSSRAFVLVVVDKNGRQNDTEAYGDWLSYLESFIERDRGELPVYRVAPERARSLLPRWPKGLRNATLFVNHQGKGLLYRGLILEPDVYRIGKDFAEHAAPAHEAASFGLVSFDAKAK